MSLTPPSLLLAAFPVELVDAIAGYTEPTDLPSLSRTSKQMNSICVRRIYASVLFDDVPRAVCCLKTLVSNSPAASYVKTLTIELDVEDSTILIGFSRLLRAAMQRLTSLVRFRAQNTLDILRIISDVHLPALRMCFVPLPDVRPVVRFLQLHPELVRVTLCALTPTITVPDIAFSQISLPKLQYFAGPDYVAGKVLPQTRSVTQISIFWDPTRGSAFSTLFEDFPAESLQSMNNMTWRWDAALLRDIAAHAPNITSLTIHNGDGEALNEHFENFVLQVDDALGTLQSLRTLELSTPGEHPLHPSGLETQFAHIRRWTELAPALRCVIFPDSTSWVLLSYFPGVWFPTSEHDNEEKVIERARWATRYYAQRAAELPPQYRVAAEVWLGTETLERLQRGESSTDEVEDSDSEDESDTQHWI